MVIVILAIVVIALVVAALLYSRQRRSQQLQEGFGPEYDRTLEERGGDRREAEAELHERRQRREQFEVRELEPAAHDISGRATAGEASTEDLRQAMVHFRALFVELLGRDEQAETTEPPRDGGVPQNENVREMR